MFISVLIFVKKIPDTIRMANSKIKLVKLLKISSEPLLSKTMIPTIIRVENKEETSKKNVIKFSPFRNLI